MAYGRLTHGCLKQQTTPEIGLEETCELGCSSAAEEVKIPTLLFVSWDLNGRVTREPNSGGV